MQQIPEHDGGPFVAAPTRVVARWPAGSFAENLLVKNNGEILIALYSDNRIDRYNPASGQVIPFSYLPAPVVSIAEGADGQIWAVAGTFYTGPGGVWKIGLDGVGHPWVGLPDARFLNGCAVHPDGHTLLVCDSHLGHVLAIDLRQPHCVESWLTDTRFVPLIKQLPGANGIQFFRDHVWISVTDQNLIYRAPLRADGTAGTPEVIHKSLHVDDFTFGEDGALYYTTHTLNTVGRVNTNGERITFGGPEQELVGATACVFGRMAPLHRLLYVTTDGGFFRPYPGSEQAARLVEIDVG
jgi:sugar lactone lactonase YvrE